MFSKNVLKHGSKENLPEVKKLKLGPISLLLEEASLRYIKLGETEILRRIYVAVRDKSWYTVPMELSNLNMNVSEEGFYITFEASHRHQELNFSWRGTIEGKKEGFISFTMDGTANSTFLCNRIGICVLHPIKDCAGKPCVVEKIDGSFENGRFPEYISPHQPFMEIKAITHEVIHGVKAEVIFSGDTFEMEDQRNWTDDSYKTYSTPIDLPKPVEVMKGSRIIQSVVLKVKGDLKKIPLKEKVEKVDLTIEPDLWGTLPPIGLLTASHGRPLSNNEADYVKKLSLSHLHSSLILYEPVYEEKLERAVSDSRRTSLPLELSVYISDNAEEELKKLLDLIQQHKPQLFSWIIFHRDESCTGEQWVKLAKSILGAYDSKIRVGSGVYSYFADIHREKPAVENSDFICYPVNPQQHCTDFRTMIENIMPQAWTIEKGKMCTGKVPIAVIPVTLKGYINQKNLPLIDPIKILRYYDVRQMSLLAAAWTVGSIKYLSESGADSITYFETTGWAGIMPCNGQASIIKGIPNMKNGVFPLYHVFADVGEMAGGEVLRMVSADRLKVDGFGMHKDGNIRIMLCNLTPNPINITMKCPWAKMSVRTLDENNVVKAMLSPEDFRLEKGRILNAVSDIYELELLAFAIIRLDTVRREL